MDSMEPPLFTYQRNARTEGIIEFIMALIIFSIPIALWHITDDAVLLYVVYPMLVFSAVFGGRSAFKIIKRGGIYRFLIYRDRVTCESPHEEFAPPFNIPISENVALERDQSQDYAAWRVRTLSGEKFEIPMNYSTPVANIAQAILHYFPHVQERMLNE